MTEQQIPKLAGLLVEHQKSFETLPAKDGQWAIHNIAEAINLFVEAVKNRAKKAPPMIVPIATEIIVPPTDTCRSKDCFSDASIFSYRDPDIDTWLFNNLPAVSCGNGTNYKLISKGINFRGMAQAILDETTADITKLATLLVESNKTFSLKQVEYIHVLYSRGENRFNLLVNGCANFFFTHDENRNVFILHTNLHLGSWHVTVYRLNGGGGWDAGHQVFVRN
jgi:hypothetical protein